MRKLLAVLAAILLTGPGLPRARAAEVTVDVFYRGLEPHGDWIETADYGYVWHPRDVAEDWRPYTVGNWAYTDAGWTWVSEEPFGWATYHYGRWVKTEGSGWVWVPDTEWGPAWVSWRRSPKYVGWAPLPPEARFQKTVGIKSWSDSYYDIGPEYYSFVEVRQFGSPHLAKVVVQPRENVTIIRETRNITNITVVNNYVYNGGPEYDVIVRESAEPVRRLRLERRTDIAFEPGAVREETFRTQVTGDTLRIAAPDVRFVPQAAPTRVARKVEHVQVERGWNVPAAERGQVEQLRASIRKDSPKPPAELPPQPKFEKPAERATVSAPADRSQPGRAERATAGGAATPAPGAANAQGKPGAPTATPQPGATVGTPGSEERTPGTRPGRAERPGRPGGTAPTAAEPGATPEGATATTPPSEEKAPGKGKDRNNKKSRTEREQPATSGASTPPAATPGATAPGGVKPEATTPVTPATPEEATGKQKGADRGMKKGRTGREQTGTPEPTVPGTAPETTTTAPNAGTPNPSEEPSGKAKAGERGKKTGRAEREQPSTASPGTGADQTTTPGTSDAGQRRKGPGARGQESPATVRQEGEEQRLPASTPGGDRPQSSAERRGPVEGATRAGRGDRSERSDKGGERPEAAAPERGSAGTAPAGERPQSRAGSAGAGERTGRPESADGGRKQGGAGGGRERGERQGGRGGGESPESAGAAGR